MYVPGRVNHTCVTILALLYYGWYLLLTIDKVGAHLSVIMAFGVRAAVHFQKYLLDVSSPKDK